MSARILPIDPDAHQAIQALLPWYLMQTLEADEAERVRAHLADCPRCQAELAFERQLQAATALPGEATADVEHGLAALRERIRHATPPAHRPMGRWHRLLRGWQAGAPWLRWAAALQCAALLGLGTALLHAQFAADAGYRALGSASPAAAGNLLVRFRPEASERELRQALQDSGARLVDGPTVTGAYLLHVPPAQQAEALRHLRAHAAVVLAESLETGGGR
jgi:hypothetical protein